MRALVVHDFGPPENMTLVDLPRPVAGPGEVIVKVAVSGVNFIDVYFRTGLYKVPAPVSLGSEAAGVVDSVGAGVTEVAPGDRVAYAMVRGSYAEFAKVPAAQVVRIPEAVSFEQAAAVMLQGMTAHYLTRSTFPLKKGDTCLVHAAAGGTGALVVQMARLAGARVIGTVSTAEKAAIARAAGADEVIFYTEQDFAAEARRLTGGAGVDVVYDGVGKTTFDKSLDSLRPRGTMALFGYASGAVTSVDPSQLNTKGSLFLTRPSLAHHIANREELVWRATEVLDLVASGELTIRIDATYPLERAAEAHRVLEGRGTTGKLLISI
ncbi:MAG TPA: quinone oxidoreductase [Vicinamibacterales bacterium]|nr:quinone oxidoreductase [Vicinamibacterales bacterium]